MCDTNTLGRDSPELRIDRSTASIFIVPEDVCADAMWNTAGEYIRFQVNCCLRASSVNKFLQQELLYSPLWGHGYIMIMTCMIFNPLYIEVIYTCANCTMIEIFAQPTWQGSYVYRQLYKNTTRR